MKRMAITALPLLTLSLCLSIARAQENTEPDAAPAQPEEKQATPFTPLAIGNTWVYENKDDGIRSTDRVAGMVLFDGQPWYLVRTTETPLDPEGDTEPVVTELWLTHREGVEADALVDIDEDSFTLRLSSENHFLRHPVKVGDTYASSKDDPSVRVEVLAVDQEVKTPAGTFVCTVYRETIDDIEDYSFTAYLAPGVGIVRYTTESDGLRSSTDLVSFTLVEED